MYIYDQQEIREIDQIAFDQGFSLFSLMENAGKGIFSKIKKRLNKDDRIAILAGRGNNGGDGIVLARYLILNGYAVHLTFPLGEPKSEEAKLHYQYYQNAGFKTEQLDMNLTYDVIIDALLGIGIRSELREDAEKLIHWCNEQDSLKIALDIPSGALADHGQTTLAFESDMTVCVHGIKPSAFLLPSNYYYRDIEVVDIGLRQSSKVKVVLEDEVNNTFPSRNKFSHKGTFGTSLLVAGSDSMPGSALLGAIGAIRSGTGKLTIATSKFAASVIAPNVPEAIYVLNGLEKVSQGEIPEKISAMAIGPGISDLQLVEKALLHMLEYPAPLVVDAGALLESFEWSKYAGNRNKPVILTPHPGEFSRMTNISVSDIQANRIKLAKEFAVDNHVTLVLKGQYTVIAFPNGEVAINQTGNSGLAKGGSGDVLTGIMVSMLSTHKEWQHAVKNAVYIHGLCADIWARDFSQTTMTARDFDHLLPKAVPGTDTI